MDFRPNRRTLVISYIAIAGALGVLIWLSQSNPGRFYYWPEYTSHQGYTPPEQSCRQCHIRPYAAFEQKTCYTGGCHTDFDPRRGPISPEGILKLEEKTRQGWVAQGIRANGPGAENYAAVVAFHSNLGDAASCSECHPSHRLPQKGRFNEFTIREELEKRLSTMPEAPTPEALTQLRADIFHNEAQAFVGAISCNRCHATLPEWSIPKELPPG